MVRQLRVKYKPVMLAILSLHKWYLCYSNIQLITEKAYILTIFKIDFKQEVSSRLYRFFVSYIRTPSSKNRFSKFFHFNSIPI